MLHATVAELDAAEAKLNVNELVKQGLAGVSRESYRYVAGRAEVVETSKQTEAAKRNAAIA